MPLSHQTKLFGVNDAAVYKMLTDPPGAPPTYAAQVNVVGVKHLVSKMSMDIKTLRGDNTLLAADAVFREISGDLAYAKFNFDLMAALMSSATVADSGTTPNQITKITVSQADVPASFKIEAQSKQTDYITGGVAGDMHFILWKCTASSLDMFGFDEENYNNQGVSYTSFPVLGTPTGLPANSWATALANENNVSIV